MINRDDIKKIDIGMLLILCILVGISIMAIGSATKVHVGGSLIHVKKQILFFTAGFILMTIATLIDYHIIATFHIPLYIVNIILLGIVLVGGHEGGGAARWINLGFMTLQPSELAKIIMVICLSKIIDKYQYKLNKPYVLILVIVYTIIPFAMILMQPDLSTSIVILVILVIELYIGNIDYKYIAGAIIIGVPIMLALFLYIQNPDQVILRDYQRNRIMETLHGEDNSEAGMQTKQSVHAIASGGLHGKGLYEGTVSQLNYLPEPHTDFIFAVIGEELGFVGSMTVLGLFILLIARGFWIARGAPDLLGKLIVSTYMVTLAFQVFINIGVVTDLLPNTGLPLPFVSAGGSSLIANMIGIGLVLNVGIREEITMF
ncbi:MAG TPA: rod shape-determining protein RodA [Epulopiscium sp.]|nr:rod shape-determining protein RodA [Candidatus Epulonipiscium sp.]